MPQLKMYEKLKNTVRQIIPNRFLKKNEAFFRKLIALRYRGNKYECNLCGFQLARFVELENGEKLCPKCGSLPRSRRLWTILREEVKLGGKTILHFSPSKQLSQKIAQSAVREYVTSDYEGEFAASQKYDITAIDQPDDRYDLIICYHVLEHIEADRQAMRELYRVLKPGGQVILQTPFKTGDIYENSDIKTKEARLLHFGQQDHVRVYSVDGLSKRLSEAGFIASIRQYQNEPYDRYGLKEQETVLMVKK